MATDTPTAIEKERNKMRRRRVIIDQIRGLRKCLIIAVPVALLATATISAGAVAAPPPLFWQAPEDGLVGSGSGQLQEPLGMVSDPSTGDLFVVDRGNNRIDEFDAWGSFVKSFGWGVVASGPDRQTSRNERQDLTVNATGGTFTLRYWNAYQVTRNEDSNLQITAPLAYSSTAAEVQAALEGLQSLAPGDLTVTGPPGGPWTIEFSGDYADSDIPPLQPETLDAEGHSTLSGGGESATVNTLQNGGSYEICVPANGDVCQAGQVGGASPGEFAGPSGIALDAAGNLYVQEGIPPFTFGEASSRVQKFDSAGHFLLAFGGEVDKTTGADVCSKADLEAGDACGAGVPGAGAGMFETPSDGHLETTRIAVGPGGDVFVGDKERIEEFSAEGAFLDEVPVPGETITGLAVNGKGDFYAIFGEGENNDKQNVRELSPTGTPLGELPVGLLSAGGQVGQPGVLAVDANENVFVSERNGAAGVFEFDSSGKQLIGSGEKFANTSAIGGLATSSACGVAGEDLYVSGGGVQQWEIRAYGPAPDPAICPPPSRPPTISEQYAVSVASDGATVRAELNPHFWSDADYYVEYGLGKCSEGGCTTKQPAAPGSRLTEAVQNIPLLSGSVFLSGLQPNTTYHYRFVATSGGGGPTFGIDPDGQGPGAANFAEGEEGAFTTFSQPANPLTACANSAYRSGTAAALPDCRAYELVTPLEKGNGDIAPVGGSLDGFNQAAETGEGKLAYTSYRAFGDSPSAPANAQYIASRTATGWSSHGISPPQGVGEVDAVRALFSKFKLFSPDLCSAWLWNTTSSLLAEGAVPGFPTIYRRSNCASEADTYTTLGPLTSAPPKYREPRKFLPELQGVSADGKHAIFRVSDRLTDSGPDLGSTQTLLYESFGAGKLRLVCILPNGTVAPAGCTAGTSSENPDASLRDSVSHAISSDGSRIFWSDVAEGAGVLGDLYVRIAGKNPTVQITSEPTQFLDAAADGSRAIYAKAASPGALEAGADLFEYDVDAKTETLIAHKVVGILGASEDARRIYLVSKEELEGQGKAGKPNLYLYEVGAGGGHFSFIAVLSTADATAGNPFVLSPVSLTSISHTARVSADGSVALFMSNSAALAQATAGYENTDLNSGQDDSEVYRFDATSGTLDCLSCNPSNVRPDGRDIGGYWAAARIAASENELYAPRVLSANGKRVFFESFEALVPADTNGREDVYEWEAPSEGDCEATSSSYRPGAGGCVSLISSGRSAQDSAFIDASADGNDAYIATAASLVPQDPGLIDIYDARVGGGFAPPTETVACEGEACQGPYSRLSDLTPASLIFQGAGNLVATPAAPLKPPAKKPTTKPKAKKHKTNTHKTKKPKAKKSKARRRKAKKSPAEKARVISAKDNRRAGR